MKTPARESQVGTRGYIGGGMMMFCGVLSVSSELELITFDHVTTLRPLVLRPRLLLLASLSSPQVPSRCTSNATPIAHLRQLTPEVHTT